MLGQAILNSIRRWLKDEGATWDDAISHVSRLVAHADEDEQSIRALEAQVKLLREKLDREKEEAAWRRKAYDSYHAGELDAGAAVSSLIYVKGKVTDADVKRLEEERDEALNNSCPGAANCGSVCLAQTEQEKAEKERDEWKSKAFEIEAAQADECENCEFGKVHRDCGELRGEVKALRKALMYAKMNCHRCQHGRPHTSVEKLVERALAATALKEE